MNIQNQHEHDHDTKNQYVKFEENPNNNPSSHHDGTHDDEIGDHDDDDDYDYDDEEIQRDAANDTVAFIVYLSLLFFMALFFGVTISIIIIVGQYGFVVFMILCILVFIVALLSRFIIYYMEQDRVLKPMRKKMRRWHAIATAVVVNEFKNFHLDLNDHLLLTYDENYQGDVGDHGDEEGDNKDDGKKRSSRWRRGGGSNQRRRRGPRSKLFGLLVQPLLKKKDGQNRLFGGKRKKDKKDPSHNDAIAEGVTADDHAFV